jgi:AcrR family transcriptional regulator
MTEKKTRGRQRSSESQEAILAATAELLTQKPLRNITIEAIASKAGVGKVTIYRWWPTKAYVALDACRRILARNIPVSDTGDIRTDLTTLLRYSLDLAAMPEGKIVGQFLAETQDDPQFALLFRDKVVRPRRDAIGELLDRAAKRGEINPKIDKDFIIDLLYAPIIFRNMVGSCPPSMNPEEMICAVLYGIGSLKSSRGALSLRQGPKPKTLRRKKS